MGQRPDKILTVVGHDVRSELIPKAIVLQVNKIFLERYM